MDDALYLGKRRFRNKLCTRVHMQTHTHTRTHTYIHTQSQYHTHKTGAKNSNRGGNNQAHSGHQRSFVGHKRGREDTEADERKALIALLMELGDKPQVRSSNLITYIS